MTTTIVLMVTMVMGRMLMRMMVHCIVQAIVMMVWNGRMGKHQQIRCEKTE